MATVGGIAMARVAGIDGAPSGWAVVVRDWSTGWTDVLFVRSIVQLLESQPDIALIAIDVPIGLLEVYEAGGRVCDRLARAALGPRASSVFPAPIRPTLTASTWREADGISRNSSAEAKGMSQQAFGIIPKVKEVDDLLRNRPALREMIYEVHPELCFKELEGAPLKNPKKSPAGRNERQSALSVHFVKLEQLNELRRQRHIQSVDFLDAAAACWSANRIHRGIAEPYGDVVSRDASGLPMVIWA